MKAPTLSNKKTENATCALMKTPAGAFSEGTNFIGEPPVKDVAGNEFYTPGT